MDNETDIILTAKQRRDFKKAIATLDRIRQEVASTSDNYINWYLDDDSLCLLDGESHEEGRHGLARTGFVIEALHLQHSGGGGF